MEPASVVLYHKDAGVAQTLATDLSQHFRSVYVARACPEIRSTVARYRADVLVLDLEGSCLDEVKSLHREFPDLSIVCMHRLADEELWAEALRQGAADMCEPRGTHSAVRSVLHERAHRAAA